MRDRSVIPTDGCLRRPQRPAGGRVRGRTETRRTDVLATESGSVVRRVRIDRIALEDVERGVPAGTAADADRFDRVVRPPDREDASTLGARSGSPSFGVGRHTSRSPSNGISGPRGRRKHHAGHYGRNNWCRRSIDRRDRRAEASGRDRPSTSRKDERDGVPLQLGPRGSCSSSWCEVGGSGSEGMTSDR